MTCTSCVRSRMLIFLTILSICGLCGRATTTAAAPRWEGFLPGADLKDCRVNLPLYLYFSEPMDASRERPVAIIDTKSGKPFEDWEGRYPGDQSCFEINLKRPLSHGRTYRIDFTAGDKQFRSVDGELFDLTTAGRLSFSTHSSETPPRPLYVRLRNDNTHVSVAGMHQMLAHGMDLIELNCVHIKDGWISNHLVRPHNAGTKVNVINPGTSIPEGKDGDYPAFKRITTEPPDTTYATYAAVDYIDTTDGKIDPLPRFEDVLKVIQQWDRPIHLQIEAPKATTEDFEELFRNTGLDVSKIHSWHSDGAARPNVPLSKERESRTCLFYPPHGKGLGDGFTPDKADFPNGMTPRLIAQAHADGKTSWLYSYVTKPNVVMAARLGVQYMCDNDLAYEGKRLSRIAMYELNDYNGNQPPRVIDLTIDGKQVDGRSDVPAVPGMVLRFTDMMELRSVNFETVTLHNVTAADRKQIPLFIEAEEDFQAFRVRPQEPLKESARYVLSIGGRPEHGPFDLGGMPVSRKWQATFTVVK